MARFEIDLTLTVDVKNGAAIRRLAYESIVDREALDAEGFDFVADGLSATTELALSVVIAQPNVLDDALFALAGQIGHFEYIGKRVEGDSVRRIDEWID